MMMKMYERSHIVFGLHVVETTVFILVGEFKIKNMKEVLFGRKNLLNYYFPCNKSIFIKLF